MPQDSLSLTTHISAICVNRAILLTRYAYKHGYYQRCLQRSTQNVRTHAVNSMLCVLTNERVLDISDLHSANGRWPCLTNFTDIVWLLTANADVMSKTFESLHWLFCRCIWWLGVRHPSRII